MANELEGGRWAAEDDPEMLSLHRSSCLHELNLDRLKRRRRVQNGSPSFPTSSSRLTVANETVPFYINTFFLFLPICQYSDPQLRCQENLATSVRGVSFNRLGRGADICPRPDAIADCCQNFVRVDSRTHYVPLRTLKRESPWALQAAPCEHPYGATANWENTLRSR